MRDRTPKNPLSLKWLALPATIALLAGCAPDSEPAPTPQDPALQRSQAQAPAASSPQLTPAADPDWDAKGFARERGISVEEARQRLGWQVLAPRLSERAATELGEAFGGVWIDVDGGDRVKVGVAGKAGASAQTAVKRAAIAAGLTEGYDVVEVEHPMAELERENTWLGAEVARVNEGAHATLASGLRTNLNKVVLRAPAGGGLNAAQRELIATATTRLGDLLVVGTHEGHSQERACNYPFCDPPLLGGVEIGNSTTFCTGGLIAQSKVDSKLYQFTAGHCVPGSGQWSAAFANGSSQVIGPVHNFVFGASGDMAILEITNTALWNPQPMVNVTASSDTTANETYAINSDDLSMVGQRICTTGAFLGHSSCGSVTDLGVTATIDGVTVNNLGEGSFCGVQGDSGAPMFASHVAYGIQKGGFSQCDSLYQGIRSAELAMNVNVLHAP